MTDGLKINVVTQLVMLVSFALAMNIFGIAGLSVCFVGLGLVLCGVKGHHFLKMLKRVKWVCVIIVVVYGLNTPGQHLSGWPEAISPTYEGLVAGGTQILRVICMLALLAYILTSNSRSQLISGFYFTLSPLGFLGVDVKRFAVRLWLTLHYVETNPKFAMNRDFLTHFDWHLSEIFNQKDDALIEISLHQPVFNTIDFLAIGLCLLLFVLGVSV